MKPASTEELSKVHSKGAGRQREPASRPLRIAIVEDDEELLNVVSILVRSLGHELVFEGNSGAEVVSLIEERKIHPDAILMDYRIPGMNGIEAAEEVGFSDPKVKIVIMTADDSVKAEATDLGLLYISKPFSSEDLVRVLEAATG